MALLAGTAAVENLNVWTMHLFIYDDNSIYGGHQAMSAHGLEALAAEGMRLTILLHPGNTRWRTRLETLRTGRPHITVIDAPTRRRKLEGIWSVGVTPGLARLEALLREARPDALLALQGDIEGASAGLRAARRAGLPAISYLALPHRLAEMGAKAAWVRDFFNRRLFRWPDQLITIAPALAGMARQRGFPGRPRVVPNGIETGRFQPQPELGRSWREGLGWTGPAVWYGLVGRVEFKQKGQDWLVQALARHPPPGPWRLVILGDGPDLPNLRRMIADLNLQDRVHLLPWTEDTVPVLNGLDALVIPSWFEGVPLVMLEALSCGIPVVASDRDGMRDLLPASWRFPPGHGEGLAAALEAVARERGALLPTLVERVRREHSMDAFRAAFVQAVRESIG